MNAKSIALAAIALACASNSAWAGGRHHHHHRGSFGFNVVIGTGIATAAYSTYPYRYYQPRYYYPYPPAAYYYPAPVVTVMPPAPPVYVEQQPAPLASNSLPSGYWYYCGNPQGYYPSVQTCPQGWQKVLPQPPSQQ